MDPGETRRQPISQLLSQLEETPLIHLPMCIYVADGEGRVVYANRETRALLELPARGPVDASIAELHAEPGGYAALLARVDRPGKTLVHLKVRGRDVWLEHYLGRVPDGESQDTPLYVGCMVDITEDHVAAARTAALQETVREMTFDIGQILHANTSTLVMVNQTLLAAARSLEPELDADHEACRPDRLEERMAERATSLVSALSRLLQAGDAQRRIEALAPERWEKLEGLLPMLEGYEEMIPVPEMRISALRAVTGEILRACRQIEPGHMPKEVVRDTLRAASDLERLTCFIDIRSARTAVIQMDTSLASLRDFTTTEIRTDDPNARFTLAGVVREAIAHLAEFARAARVEVVWRNRSEDIEVFGNRRDVLRAVTNLIHNAIKYSWKREGHESPWIAIDISDDEQVARVEVENWGVPVEQTEIDTGLVFHMGYRGKRSKDRGRLGTGIGLTDSKRVAEAHGGSLGVTSRPARAHSPEPTDRDYYRQPFLTKVTMILPLAV